MMTRVITIPALLFSTISLAQPADEAVPALSVSPGGIEAPTWLSDPCPTFSWGAVPGANGYELAVFPVLDSRDGTYSAQSDQGKAVVKARIAAPSLSWTPGGDNCLSEDGSYVWFVQASTADSEGGWSEGRRFELDLSGGLLAETVRQEILTQLSQPDTWKAAVQAALGGESGIALGLPRTIGPISPKAKPVTTSIGDAVSVLSNTGVLDRGVISRAATFTNPSAFRISGENGVVFDRSSTPSGTGIPAEGAGTRFMWYPGKAALRAGYVYSDQWDDANIGEHSTAMGSNTTASGSVSVAMGGSTVAIGPYSTAFGDRSTATGYAATALGFATNAIGTDSTALNNQTTASGASSTTMGSFTTASGQNSVAMGAHTTAESGYETAIGRWNTDYEPGNVHFGWVLTDRLFVIGNGIGEDVSERSDAMVVLKNGHTGIGISEPVVPLQVDGGSDCKADSGGYLIANGTSGRHLCIDDNEITVRDGTGGNDDTLHLSVFGGTTSVWGELEVRTLAAATGTHLCINGDTLATCSSSGRYKEAIESLPMGLDVVERLDPVAFKWKDREERDLGFVAEQVAEVDPLLVTYNKEGEIQGVKYPQLTAVLVNAVKEQQAEIDLLHHELRQYKQLAKEVAALKQQISRKSGLLVAHDE